MFRSPHFTPNKSGFPAIMHIEVHNGHKSTILNLIEIEFDKNDLAIWLGLLTPKGTSTPTEGCVCAIRNEICFGN